MTRRAEPTPAQLRRLLAPERHPDLSREDTVPTDLDRVVDHQDQHERSGVDAGILEDAAAVLEVLEHAAKPAGNTATLAMPLGYFIDADGTRTDLGLVEIDVKLHVPGVLEALAGKLFTGDEGGMLTVPTRIERRLTPEGADAIRALYALLSQGGDA